MPTLAQKPSSYNWDYIYIFLLLKSYIQIKASLFLVMDNTLHLSILTHDPDKKQYAYTSPDTIIIQLRLYR